MKIKSIKSQHRSDFTAVLVCDHCGHEQEVRGYDDANYHKNVIPSIICESCDKNAGDDYRPLTTNGVNVYHVWPDETLCAPEELEEYLTFMSDDYLTVYCDVEDTGNVPEYALTDRRLTRGNTMKPCKCCGSTSAETTRSETQHYRTDLMRIQCNQCGHSEPIHTWGIVSPEVALEIVLESGYSVITDKPGNGENERYESECLTIMKRNNYKSADQMTFEQRRRAHVKAMRIIR